MRPASRSLFSWVALGFGLIACLGLAVGAYRLAAYAWAQVADYKSPFVHPSTTGELSSTGMWVPAGLRSAVVTMSPVLSQRVVLVIIDGMREDVSRSQMNSLNKLRSYGMDLTLTAPQPSLSHPNWTTILSGAPPEISGVTTNGQHGRAPVPTLLDMAAEAGRRVEIVGPEDFAELYGVKPGPNVSLRPWPKGGYLTRTLVNDALRIAKAVDPQLIVIHLPDLDEAGHEHGGASAEYRQVAHEIDVDVGRLVAGLESPNTTFVITADHGHIDPGGHGGWEPVAIDVPGIVAGAGARLGSASGRLEQVAPTVSILAGIPIPPYASSTALRSVLTTSADSVFARDEEHHVAFERHYYNVVTNGAGTVGPDAFSASSADQATVIAAKARAQRISLERSERLPLALGALAAALLVVALLWVASWRALLAALTGAVAYYAIYYGLFFGAHRFAWSLSALNTEENVQTFMYGRMAEAAVAGLVAVAVAAFIYPLFRRSPRGPQDTWFLSGWLALAPATILFIQSTLVVQLAWYQWRYGMSVSWVLPDFRWAFKADLDMVQMTALAIPALLGMLVTYLVGRYHPKVVRGRAGGGVSDFKT